MHNNLARIPVTRCPCLTCTLPHVHLFDESLLEFHATRANAHMIGSGALCVLKKSPPLIVGSFARAEELQEEEEGQPRGAVHKVSTENSTVEHCTQVPRSRRSAPRRTT